MKQAKIEGYYFRDASSFLSCKEDVNVPLVPNISLSGENYKSDDIIVKRGHGWKGRQRQQ